MDAVRELALKGDYAAAREQAAAAGQLAPNIEEWPMLEIEADLALGVIPRAGVLERPWSVSLTRCGCGSRATMCSVKTATRTGKGDLCRARSARRAPRVGLSRAGGSHRPRPCRAARGHDPKRVLEVFFDPVKKSAPEFRGSYLASGELALEKNDFALAAKILEAAAKKFPEDPEIQFGLARAFAPSDAERWRGARDHAETQPATRRRASAARRTRDHGEHYRGDRSARAALKVNPERAGGACTARGDRESACG